MRIITQSVEALSVGRSITVVSWKIVQLDDNTAELVIKMPGILAGGCSEELRDLLMASPRIQEACVEYNLTDPVKVDCGSVTTAPGFEYVGCVFTTPRPTNWVGIVSNVVLAVAIGTAVGAVAVYLKNK